MGVKMKLRAPVLLAVLVAAAHAGIHESISKGDLAGVKSAVTNGELNAKCRPSAACKHQTPIMHAVLGGHEEIAEFLLSQKPDLTITDAEKASDPQGYTPIHGAAFQGRARIMGMLIAHGENPSARHNDGFTPIHRACWGGEARHTDTVKVLLDAG